MEQAVRTPDAGGAPLRIDFLLTVHTGNRTRYQIVRPVVDSDPGVTARWYPMRTWAEDDWLRFLPSAIRIRARHVLDSWRLFARPTADAVVIHAFETYYLFACWKQLVRPSMALINHPDGYVLPNRLTRYAVRHTDYTVLWNTFMREYFEQTYPDVPKERILVMHPGIDLRKWPVRERKEPTERFTLLFVGADLMRKGADVLLEAYGSRLADTCSLDIATVSGTLPADFRQLAQQYPHCRLELDHPPGSEGLQALFRRADVFVLPTRMDSSPWVIIEAMATGVPVISTPIAGIPDMVIDGETGLLVPVEDSGALAEAVDRLRRDPELANRLARNARAHVEANFDVHVNWQRMRDLASEAARRRKARTRRDLRAG